MKTFVHSFLFALTLVACDNVSKPVADAAPVGESSVVIVVSSSASVSATVPSASVGVVGSVDAEVPTVVVPHVVDAGVVADAKK